MKYSARTIRHAALLLLAAGLVLAGCTAAGPEAPTGTMGLMLELPTLPPGGRPMDVVTLTLEPAGGGEPAVYELDVVQNTASAEIEVTPGTWNIDVDVFDTEQTVVATGNGFAVVLPGTVTEVNLTLQIVSGGIDIDIDWDDGPPLYVADISHRRAYVEINGLGQYEISGLSRIGWDIEVFEFPVTDERTIKEPGALSYPDLAMLYLRGSQSEVDNLTQWTPESTPREISIILEGLSGEEMRVNFYEVVLVSSNTDVFEVSGYETEYEMGGVRVRYDHFEVASYEGTFREPGYWWDSEPGQKVEIDGVDVQPSYPLGVLDAPLPGENPAFWLPSIYKGQAGIDWGEDTLDVLEDWNSVVRKSMSIINIDANGDEIDRDNIYEVWPAGINIFNPEKEYGATFLVDVFIVGELVEDG